jgi:hypothetical protein
MHGVGVDILHNGEKYEGEFVHSKRHGRGTYTWVNGNKYEGQFQHGRIHGRGIFTVANGDVYDCTFVNEQRSGLGTCRRPLAPLEYQFWRNGAVLASTNLLEIAMLVAVVAASLYLM